MKKGIEKGKLKGEIKGEVSKIKMGIKFNVPKDQIILELKFLTDPKLLSQLEHNLEYIKKS